MKVRFLGTRGSIPAPGEDTIVYGGNTSCVEFTSDENVRVIIDAGTGIRKINKNFKDDADDTVKFFFTHSHWDHLQGLPFFSQLFFPDKKILIYIDVNFFDEIKDAIIKQMSGKTFPVQFSSLPSVIKFIPVDKSHVFSENLKIELFNNNHPGGSTGIKFINNNKIFVFVTDNEIKLLKEKGDYDNFKKFCHSADIIVHDGQYLEKEMKIKRGWGHTTIEDLVSFYMETMPKIGVFTHHDPERKDSEIEEMEKWANSEMKKNNMEIKILAAKEDTVLEI
ncbi:MAG TPA: MBL fold metallo-hydrolase [Spirochaetota bacterium]|nr:MBL fold metallo-hydrolase [Spirochaetota bacterium]